MCRPCKGACATGAARVLQLSGRLVFRRGSWNRTAGNYGGLSCLELLEDAKPAWDINSKIAAAPAPKLESKAYHRLRRYLIS